MRPLCILHTRVDRLDTIANLGSENHMEDGIDDTCHAVDNDFFQLNQGAHVYQPFQELQFLSLLLRLVLLSEIRRLWPALCIHSIHDPNDYGFTWHVAYFVD